MMFEFQLTGVTMMKLSYEKVDFAAEVQRYQEELMLRLEPVVSTTPIHTAQWKPEFDAVYAKVCAEVETTHLISKHYLN
jgi:hypothetical protein